MVVSVRMGLTPTHVPARLDMKDAIVNTKSTHARIIRVKMVHNAETAAALIFASVP